MTNILDDVMGMLTNDVVGSISNKIGEDSAGVSSALGGLIPSILGGMVNKAEAGGSSFSSIFDMIKNQGGNLDVGGLVNQIGTGNLSQNDPRDAGGGLIGSLLGSKAGSLIDAVSGMAGIGKKSSSSLLGMAAPLVMGYLSRKISGQKMGANDLAGMLLGQKSSIMGAIPAVLSSVLGFGNTPTTATSGAKIITTPETVRSTATTAAATATARTQEAASSGLGFLKWLLPLLLLGALAWFGLRSCDTDLSEGVNNTVAAAGETVSDATDKVGEMADDAVDATSDAMTSLKETANGMWERALPGGATIEANKEGVEYSLIDFIESDNAIDEDTWFNFDALRFQSGSANIDAGYSQRQIDNMYEVLKAYPDVKLKIGGYTDSDGGEAGNLKLSQARANNVKAAIVTKGISADRIETEGYGEAHPVAPNDTPENKARNRRIAARVTAK